MRNRLLLALPAVVCLMAGGLLGTWGWGQRDEARAKIRAAPVVPEDGGFFDVGSGSGDDTHRQMVCGALFDAADLRVPMGNGLGLGPLATEAGPPSPETTPVEVESAEIIMEVLEPYNVYGVEGLDQPAVVAAMAAQQDAMRRALRAGRNPANDPDVLDAASNLGLILITTC